MLSRRTLLACLAALGLATAPLVGHGQDDVPVVAGASDLQFALAEIAGQFKAETGKAVRLSMGSSGNFARQIRQGAPFEMYLSADEAFVLDLHRDGFTRDEGDLYAIGRIVVIAPSGSPLEPDQDLANLEALLAGGAISRFAIANPEHAPYGRAAREALITRGLWDAVEPRLVLGENVSQAAQFATSGNAEGGIIAYSLALSPQVSALATWTLLPETWHEPLRQRMVLLPDAGPVAEAFYAYVQEPAARAVFRKYGFVLPGEQS
jgi:molybdate transport system substrate-binding protein